MKHEFSRMPKIDLDQVSWEVGLKLSAIVAVIVAMVWLYFSRSSDGNTLVYALVFVLGGLLGLTEILGRYIESPASALKSSGAFFYVLVNASASALALFLLARLAPEITNPITQVLLSVLGAMAFLRSSVFRAKVGNEDVAIGPAIILDTLLK